MTVEPENAVLRLFDNKKFLLTMFGSSSFSSSSCLRHFKLVEQETFSAYETDRFQLWLSANFLFLALSTVGFRKSSIDQHDYLLQQLPN